MRKLESSERFGWKAGTLTHSGSENALFLTRKYSENKAKDFRFDAKKEEKWFFQNAALYVLLFIRSFYHSYPTGPFTILEPQDEESGKFYVGQKRSATNSEAINLWKCQSGSENNYFCTNGVFPDFVDRFPWTILQTPTDPFAILEPQNMSIDNSDEHEIPWGSKIEKGTVGTYCVLRSRELGFYGNLVSRIFSPLLQVFQPSELKASQVNLTSPPPLTLLLTVVERKIIFISHRAVHTISYSTPSQF